MSTNFLDDGKKSGEAQIPRHGAVGAFNQAPSAGGCTNVRFEPEPQFTK